MLADDPDADVCSGEVYASRGFQPSSGTVDLDLSPSNWQMHEAYMQLVGRVMTEISGQSELLVTIGTAG